MDSIDYIVELEDVGKVFGRNWALKHFSLKIPKGSVTCLIGPSGAGKTTLLKCLNLLHLPDVGVIRYNSEPVLTARLSDRRISRLASLLRWLVVGPSPRVSVERELSVDVSHLRKNVGMVFQEFNLWPRKTVLNNVIEGLTVVNQVKRAVAIADAQKILSEFGLSDLQNRYPHSLSSGQRQRVALARALIMGCEILLLDEVTSALDPELVAGMLQLLKGLARSGRTLIIATHHIAFAREVSDSIVMMNRGRIIEAGPPSVVLDHPAEARTRVFLNQLAQIA